MFAKEGYPYFVVFALILIVTITLPQKLIVFICFVLLALMFWFFRDPERITPRDDTGVVSSADGRVVEISEIEFEGERCIKIGVFMNIFSVHVNRVPFSGDVTDVKHISGKFINADDPRASAVNERNEIYINTSYGRIVAVQVAGLVARRTVSYVKQGDVTSKGERLGIIKFSSRVDLYLPANSKVEVSLGHKVLAGLTIVAHLR